MKTLFSYLTLLLLLFSFESCSKSDSSHKQPDPAKPIVLTTKQGEKVAGDNVFSFNLFRQVATSDNKENAFISPLSVTMALGMLYNGTSPDAREEMANTLQMSNFSDTEINEYYQTMSKALLKVDPLTSMAIANSIWSEKTYPVKQSFVDVNKKYFDAEVQSLDFKLKSTLDAINKRCKKKTNDKIIKILDDIPGDAIMYLINAVYFKSKWQSEFDKKDTKREDFTREGGVRQQVDMMNQTATFPYYEDNDLQVIEMPYGNGAFSMVAILPADGKTLDELVNTIDNDIWNNVLSNLRERKVQIKFPRFKIECEFSLVNPIKNMGMQLIFKTGGNLNGIADDPRLFVSEIKHKTFVEVNEEGTEAAAVTAIEMRLASIGPSSQPQFFANRPFLYLIKEKSTGAILFIGRMDKPV
ncbi:MAG: serpin family protein [Prevotellaceae bacterium]|jgi:serpin B|nr:serpin family protein [Prevotellaceae bacterium]